MTALSWLVTVTDDNTVLHLNLRLSSTLCRKSYFDHFDFAKLRPGLHDCYLGKMDKVCRQNIDPAALQYSMQRCRISNQTITQPFLIRLSWNLAWLLFSCKQSSLDTKQLPCSTAIFHAAHSEFLSAKNSSISQWIELKLHYRLPRESIITQPFFNQMSWNFVRWLPR